MARRVSLFRRLVTTGLVLIAIPALLVTLSAGRTFRRFDRERIEDRLRTEVNLVGRQLSGPEGLLPDAEIERFCRRLAAEGATATRITVLALDGRVIGDSREAPAAMDNHANRPEVRAALQTGWGTAVRFSRTVGEDMIYVAVPVRHGGQPVATIRGARPVAAWRDAVGEVTRQVGLAAGVLALLAGVCWLWLTSRVSRALGALARVSARYAEGDFSAPLPESRTREVAILADAMAAMARKLDSRVRTLIAERNERHAMLACMIEGALAVNTRGRIVYVNPAAERMLAMDLGGGSAAGRPVEACVRSLEWLALVRDALEATEPVRGEIPLGHPPDRRLAVQGIPLRNVEGARIGALIMMQDVTDMRRLESVRQQFVANVSHELKTPITSILGFVETLLDDAAMDAADRVRFLGIVCRQAQHLNAIVNDLLTLSRLEHDSDGREVLPLEDAPVAPVLRDAVELCRAKAEARRIDLAIAGDDALRARINARLLEQALVNLIDNAVKYSAEGAPVRIAAVRDGNEVVVSVADTGSGIESRHIDRIFERFYRIDKGRSRDMGGTGLGLAIVNHIARVHRGRVSVESTPGRGSTFRIHLIAAA